MRAEQVIYRPPRVEDGKSIWKLVRSSGVLDLNSVYCYLLLCRHNRETCAVAESRGRVVGFVTGYLPPGRDDTLFIWQIGVDSALRGRNHATRLLLELLQRGICREVSFLETTVAPSNRASRALFAALAKRLNSEILEQPCFDAETFPDGNHESENLLRIGPFSCRQII